MNDLAKKQQSIMFEWALIYERLGFSVIPIGNDKKPLIPTWKEFQKRSATLDEIRRWFKQYPDMNTGIICGRVSGLTVVDVDLEKLPAELAEPLKNGFSTPWVKTGGKRHQLFFRYDPDFLSRSAYREHIDVKNDGGYVVAPPSLHPSGKRYEYIVSPQAVAPAIMPQEIKDWILAEVPTANVELKKFNPSVLQGVTEGSRNESAASVAGKLLHVLPEGEWPTIGWGFLQGWNLQNRPPLPENELKRVFLSIASKEKVKANPRELFPPGQFPEISVAETNYSPQIQNWEAFLTQDTEKTAWLIERVLRPGCLAVIGGHGKHGKSTLVLHMLNALRQGTNFITQCTPTPVGYINCEMSPEDVRDILRAIGINSSGENAFIINQPPLPLDVQWLEDILAKQPKPGVCAIDSFRGAFLLSSDTENQAGTVGGILRGLQLIARKTGWTIFLIHHFRKSGTGEPLDLAGSGEWLSAPDVVLTWHRPSPYEPGTLTILGRVPPWEQLSIRLSRESFEFLGTAKEHGAESERQRILEKLSGEWSSTEEVIEAIGSVPSATVRRRLAELYEEGRLDREGEGKKGNPYQWRIR